MERNAITRAVLEAVVNRAIQDIVEDPRRSLRKLVDMGEMFAKGRSQQQYISLIQRLLENGGSPYYDLVRDTARHVERRSLCTFGINVGWQSWNIGAEHIRVLEAERGYHIPWCLTLDLGVSGMDSAEYSRLLSEAKGEGIYTFFLRCSGERSALELAFRLAREAPECAFLLFLSGTLPDVAAPELTELLNLAIFIDTTFPGWTDQAALLRREHRFFGFFRRFSTPADLCHLLSGAWTEELLPQGGALAFCLYAPGCSAAQAESIHAYVEKIRLDQRSALFFLDYYKDILFADQVISSDARFLSLAADGRAMGFDGLCEYPLELSFPGCPLRSLLERAFPLSGQAANKPAPPRET